MKAIYINKKMALVSTLDNLGNTCYINATIQMLARTPQFLAYFLKQNTQLIGDLKRNIIMRKKEDKKLWLNIHKHLIIKYDALFTVLDALITQGEIEEFIDSVNNDYYTNLKNINPIKNISVPSAPNKCIGFFS